MTNSLPPVTVAIAMYDEEAYIGDAIRSVLAQTHGDFEILVLDDGSTDASCDIVRSFEDPRIKLVSDGRNLHQAARHNQATDLAAHGYIARLDADDMMAPDRLEKQVRFLVGNEDLALVSTDMYQMTYDCRLIGRLRSGRDTISIDRLLRGGGGIAHGATIFRTDWLRRHRYREEMRRNEDADLWVRAHLAGDLRVGFIPEALTLVRQAPSVPRGKLLTGFTYDRLTARTAGISFGARLFALARSYSKEALVRTLPEAVLRRWISTRRIHEAPSVEMQRDFDAKLHAARMAA